MFSRGIAEKRWKCFGLEMQLVLTADADLNGVWRNEVRARDREKERESE